MSAGTIEADIEREVYSGTRHVGSVARRGLAWLAKGRDGNSLGSFESEQLATAAVLRGLHKAKRSNP